MVINNVLDVMGATSVVGGLGGLAFVAASTIPVIGTAFATLVIAGTVHTLFTWKK